jgi:leucine dehydrogenase
MTYKSAVARTGLGGGKSVIVGDSRTQKSPALFEAMGRFVDSFGGRYITAEDVGVGISDLESVRKSTRWVAGLALESGSSGDPSPYTALGCFEGIRASAVEVWGDDDLSGRVVAIQGPGSVGFALARHLSDAGARLIVSDVNAESVERAVRKFGATAVPPEAIYDAQCDVFTPCALGGILNDDTIPRLRCKVVAGAANNQLLDEDRHAQALLARGILYAPDYVINAGGVINVSLEFETGGYDVERAVTRVRHIFEALQTVYTTARERGITTQAAAQEVAEGILQDSARNAQASSTAG